MPQRISQIYYISGFQACKSPAYNLGATCYGIFFWSIQQFYLEQIQESHRYLSGKPGLLWAQRKNSANDVNSKPVDPVANGFMH